MRGFMKRLGAMITVILTVFALAYLSARESQGQKVNLSSLRLHMTVSELEKEFGSPFSRQRNVMTYILEDSSQLIVTLRDEVVASAIVKFHKPLQIEDPELKRLTLVQMSPADLQNENPSWFYAGKPEEGRIYKITQEGFVESVTWVPPFTYNNQPEKNLQALVQDFKIQHTSNL
jgi:hypothetical protein